jgi:hypothetical protein
MIFPPSLAASAEELIGWEGSCMRKVGVCYYFGLPIAGDELIRNALTGALECV